MPYLVGAWVVAFYPLRFSLILICQCVSFAESKSGIENCQRLLNRVYEMIGLKILRSAGVLILKT